MMVIMAELGPNARTLVHAGRRAVRPTDADRERIEHALRAKLGTDALPLEAKRAVARTVPGRASWQLLSGVIVGVSLVGGALFFAFQHGGNAVSSAQNPVPPVAAVQSPAPMYEAPAEDTAAPADLAPPVVASSKPARPAQDSLAQEVALLSRATSDLHSGNPAGALKALNEHFRKFPNGLLSEERRAARAQALCLLGRTSEGQAQLARLSPQSPAGASARQVCGAASSATQR
jgi:hypothetical protein